MSSIGILMMNVLTTSSSPTTMFELTAPESKTVRESESKHSVDTSLSKVAPPELMSFQDNSEANTPEFTTKQKNIQKFQPQIAKSKGSKESKQIFIFGDSLSDNGNLYELSEGKVPSSQQNFKGRASNGQVWTEHLNKLGTSTTNIHNFAIGGATTSSRNFISEYPGMDFQINKFKSSSVTINSNDLFIIWVGTNDYMIKATTDSKQVVDNVSQTVNTFIDKGARNIAVANLMNLGKIPWHNKSEAASALTAASENHNQQLIAALSTIAGNNPNVKITPIDFNSLFKEIIAEPEKYGFINVTDSYVGSNAQKAGSNPDEYLFWDIIHPSKRTHELMAKYAIAVMNASSTVAPQGDIALNLATRQNQSIDSRLQTLRQKPINSTKRWDVFVTGDINFGKKDYNDDFFGFDSNAASATVGADYRVTDKLTAGVAVSVAGNENKLHQNQGTINTDGYNISVYGNYSDKNFYVNSAASLGKYEFDIKRNTNFNNRIATANTDSNLFSVSINSGYDAKLGNITFGPIVGLKYDNVNINGYSEKGAGSLNIKVNDQKANSLVLSLGAQATGTIKTNIGTLIPYVRGSYEYQLADTSRTLTTEFVSQPGIPMRIQTFNSDRDYFKLSTGAEFVFSNNLSGGLSYETIIGYENFTNNTIRSEINYRF